MKAKSETTKELSRIAKFVGDRVDELSDLRNQREIAEISGFINPNMITMIKQGYTKVALDRIPGLAKALNTDPGALMLMAMEQFYAPETIRDMMVALNNGVTENEMQLLRIVRKATKNTDPKFVGELEQKVRAIFA